MSGVCPHCGERIHALKADVDLAPEPVADSHTAAAGASAYKCPQCDAILGVGEHRSDRSR